ncbi:response regulator transcription factor [Minwuia sp.]|uniref:response regulator transcription factor n=1 Tax=Minwuia sp. TaxID=2493630 RepID=UPI003A8F0E44
MATNVLIAEDEPHLVELLKFILEREGFHADAVFDGEAAVDTLRRDIPDVMILDLMLPKLDGYEVLKTVRNDDRLAKLPVLMLTAKGQDKDRKVAEDLGVNAFITKPFSNREVVDCVVGLAGQ